MELHLLAAQVVLVLVAVGTVGSLVSALLRRPPGTILIGGLVWVVIGLALAGVLGLIVLVGSGPPDDLLHIVYGVLAVSALPLAAAIAAGRSDRQRATITVVGTSGAGPGSTRVAGGVGARTRRIGASNPSQP